MVVLPKPMEPGDVRTIEIAHEGNVIAASGNGVYYVAARNNWYPSRDGLFAPYDLTFRYPKNLQLVSTGDIVSDGVEGDWRVTRRKVASPIRFAGFNLGDYDKASETRRDSRWRCTRTGEWNPRCNPGREITCLLHLLALRPVWVGGGRPPI